MGEIVAAMAEAREARTDMERIGQFVDGPFDNEVVLYRPDIQSLMGRDATEKDDPKRLDGPFPILPGHKLKAATNDWTFSPFLYLWEEEPYQDPGAWRRKDKEAEKVKNVSEDPFISSFGSKTMNGLGTYYGTFIKNLESFSPEANETIDERLKGVANFLTNPGKKGTGYGYLDITINKYPEYIEDAAYDLLEARRQMRQEFEERLVGGKWIPTAHPGDFFDANPFVDSKDPNGEEETYDWDKLLSPKPGFEDLLPWFPSNHTKCINGNKDVVSPFEKFPSYDPSDPWEPVPHNIFRKFDPNPELPFWRAQFGNRTQQQRSIIQYNVKLMVNPMTLHIH